MTGLGSGGGLYNIGVDKTPSMNITGGIIRDNQANGIGGGIQTIHGTVNLTRTPLISNTTIYYGGGLNVYLGGTAVINSSTIRDNIAGSEGGGLWLASDFTAVMTITQSSLIGNQAAIGGGGIFKDGPSGRLYVENSTLSANTVTVSDGGEWMQKGEWLPC